MKEYRITVRFSAELRRRLRETARRAGVRQSDLIRSAVENQLAAGEEAPSAYDVARKSGLIGVVRGTARDLSTNRKHFEGFGRS